jgi:hypothetical protein
MLWRRNKHKDPKDDGLLANTTTGQKFDLFDTAIEVLSRGAGGGKNPLNWATFSLGLTDVGISSGMAARGNMFTAGASAVAAQAVGMGGYAVGATVGETIGTFIAPGVGTFVGGVIGDGIGSMAGDVLARTGTTRLINKIKATGSQSIRFGGYTDTLPAYNMRQKAEQELSGSLLNARRYLGREAQLMHQ